MKKKFFQHAKILVTRTDKLGDVLLATPVLKKIREAYPQAKLSFLVQKAWMPLLQFGDEVELIEYQPQMTEKELTRLLKSKRFDVAIVIRDEKKVTWAVKAAKIPVRVGPYSTVRSLLGFNFGLLQKRSRCLMHEAEYNLQLLTRIGIEFEGPAQHPDTLPRSWVSIEEGAKERALSFLTQHGLISQKFICVHPGSGGSSRYLSFEKMVEMIKIIQKEGDQNHEKVVITGGPEESKLLQKYENAIPGVIVFGGASSTSVAELAELFSQAKGVIAHGTGPLHLAAAMNVPVFAIFPPLFVLSEKRWGPLTSLRYTWTPSGLKCPEKFRCRGVKCRYYDCMDQFEPNADALKGKMTWKKS